MKKIIVGASLMCAALSVQASGISGIPSYDLSAAPASLNFTTSGVAQFFEFGNAGPKGIDLKLSLTSIGATFDIFEDLDGVINGQGNWTSSTSPLQTIRINASNTLASVVLATGTYILRVRGSSNPGGTVAATIATVPLPAAAWLFGSALVGAGVLRRKNKHLMVA